MRANGFVYSLQAPAVCLDCGAATAVAPQDTLDQLYEELELLSSANEPVVRIRCGVCGSSASVIIEDVQVAFGLGLVAPVHLERGSFVHVCFACGTLQFSVPPSELGRLRLRVGATARPPITQIPLKRARGAA